VTLTFDFLITKCTCSVLIFVVNCTEVVNFVQILKTVYEFMSVFSDEAYIYVL